MLKLLSARNLTSTTHGCSLIISATPPIYDELIIDG